MDGTMDDLGLQVRLLFSDVLHINSPVLAYAPFPQWTVVDCSNDMLPLFVGVSAKRKCGGLNAERYFVIVIFSCLENNSWCCA